MTHQRDIDKRNQLGAHFHRAADARRLRRPVLTTKVDPLVTRACALLNFCPAVYDMAVVPRASSPITSATTPSFTCMGSATARAVHRKEEVTPSPRRSSRCSTTAPATAAGSSSVTAGPTIRCSAPWRTAEYESSVLGRGPKRAAVGRSQESPARRRQGRPSDLGRRSRQLPLAARLAARLLPAGLLRKPFTHLMECSEPRRLPFAGAGAGPRLGGACPGLD